MKHITILALPNCIAATVFGPYDVFRSAGFTWYVGGPAGDPLFQVEIVSLDGQPVSCGNRFTITPHRALAAVAQTDVLFISSPGPQVDRLLLAYPETVADIRRFHDEGTTLASACAGTFLLAEAGLLDGKIATTHWGETAAFRARYPKVKLKTERLITDEGGVVCAGGVYAALDLALYLVEKYQDRQTAMMCAKTLIIEADRDSQARFSLFAFQKQHGDRKIIEAQAWIEQHYADPLLRDELAKAHGMSARNFSRRFKKATGDTPLHYQQRLRIAAACKLLEHEYSSIEETSLKVGYEDVNFFRTVFKRHMGIAPASYKTQVRRMRQVNATGQVPDADVPGNAGTR